MHEFLGRADAPPLGLGDLNQSPEIGTGRYLDIHRARIGAMCFVTDEMETPRLAWYPREMSQSL